jgi:hypothetical protein
MRPSAPVKSGMPGGKLSVTIIRDQLTKQERPLYVRAKTSGIVLIFRWVGGERWAVLSRRVLFSTVRASFRVPVMKERRNRD